MCTCSIKLQYYNNLKNKITLHIVDGSRIKFVHVNPGCNLILIICYLAQKKKGTNCILDNI